MAGKRLPPAVRNLLSKLEPAMAKAFSDSIQGLRSNAALTDLTEAVKLGDVDEIVRLIGLDVPSFAELDRAIQEAFYQGGKIATGTLPKLPDPSGGRVIISFDPRAAAAEAWVATKSSTMITGIVESQREVIRELLEAGIASGRNPKSVALDLVGRKSAATGLRTGGVLGLTPTQSEYTQSMAKELADLDPHYFTRTLRDKRMDSSVRRAIREGKPLSSADRGKLVARYRDRLLKHRGEMIARTETLTALRAGRFEGFDQLVASGKVRDEQIKRKWNSTGDRVTREDHLDMDGQEIQGMQDPFVAPDGSQLMFPGDGSLGADAGQIIHCRCWDSIRIEFIEDLEIG